MSAFTPQATATLSVTATSSNAALGGTGSQVVFQNAGPNTAFVAFGSSTVTATTAGFPVLNGQSLQLTRPADATHMAAICASTQTATLYATPGEGD
jgi:hypothetical protein